MPQVLSPSAKPGSANTALTPSVEPVNLINEQTRNNLVSNKLAKDLDRIIRNYRTHDKKELTDGEVIVALGFVLGAHLRDEDKVFKWLTQMSVAASDAIRTENANATRTPSPG